MAILKSCPSSARKGSIVARPLSTADFVFGSRTLMVWSPPCIVLFIALPALKMHPQDISHPHSTTISRWKPLQRGVPAWNVSRFLKDQSRILSWISQMTSQLVRPFKHTFHAKGPAVNLEAGFAGGVMDIDPIKGRVTLGGHWRPR